MSTFLKFFKVIKELNSAARPDFAAQQILQKAIQELFGECSGIGVDILYVHSKQEPSQVLVRVRKSQLRKLRAAIALSSRNIWVFSEGPTLQALIYSMSADEFGRHSWQFGADGRHALVVASRAELATPSQVSLPPAEPAPGLLRPDGSINWGCPCLGGMATGPCALQFRDAFSCFHYSEAEPKGGECYEKFSVMQECMAQFPQLYGKDEDEPAALQQRDEEAPPGAQGPGAAAPRGAPHAH